MSDFIILPTYVHPIDTVPMPPFETRMLCKWDETLGPSGHMVPTWRFSVHRFMWPRLPPNWEAVY